MMKRKVKKIKLRTFAETIHDLLKSDRDVTLGCGGFSGEGKSVFTIKLQKEYAEASGTHWDFSHITWSRDELLYWIDGDKEGNGRKPEYTALLPDELISMFFKRNWYEEGQKEAIELFNKCRDRHLFIAGSIPNFWQLDSAFITRIRFYVYVPRGRHTAWIFEQEDNPFISDPWNRLDNVKLYRKKGNPYKCPNFVAEIDYGDLNPKEKREYLELRNTKRKDAEMQIRVDRVEKYSKVKKQRDALIRHNNFNKFTSKKIAGITGLSVDAIDKIRQGNT